MKKENDSKLSQIIKGIPKGTSMQNLGRAFNDVINYLASSDQSQNGASGKPWEAPGSGSHAGDSPESPDGRRDSPIRTCSEDFSELSIRYVQANKKVKKLKIHEVSLQRAKERLALQQKVHRANAIENAYYTEGGIFSLLDRLIDCYDYAESTGKPLSVGSVFTLLTQLEFKISKLEQKLTQLEESSRNAEPEKTRKESRIFELLRESYALIEQLRGNPDPAREATLAQALNELEELIDDFQLAPPLSGFDSSDSEALLAAIRDLKEKANLTSLGDDVDSPESAALAKAAGDLVLQLAEETLINHWNKSTNHP